MLLLLSFLTYYLLLMLLLKQHHLLIIFSARYYKHDLQDTMKHLEGDFYERIAEYFGTMTRTQILALTAAAQSFNRLKDLGGRISR